VKLVITLLGVSCCALGAPDIRCQTPCGLRLAASPATEDADCQAFTDLEARANAEFGWSCESEPWVVDVMSTGGKSSWVDQWGRDVAGLTFCAEQRISIASTDFKNSAMVHELFHARAECPWINTEHLGWDAALYHRIDRVNRGP